MLESAALTYADQMAKKKMLMILLMAVIVVQMVD
jgi:hypothetical protein